MTFDWGAVLLLLFSIVAVGLVSLGVYLLVSRLPGSGAWDKAYAAKWLSEHAFCPECGEVMDWMHATSQLHYDEGTGKPYRKVEWACSYDPRHTYYGMISWCHKRRYLEDYE